MYKGSHTAWDSLSLIKPCEIKGEVINSTHQIVLIKYIGCKQSYLQFNYKQFILCPSLQITDSSSSRFEVPISVPTATKRAENPDYVVEFSKTPFGLIVKRKSTGTVLWVWWKRLFSVGWGMDSLYSIYKHFFVVAFSSDSLNTTVAPLIYADQFLQISTSLPSQFIYGLGEHRSTFLHDVHWNTLTMWARDVPPMVWTVLFVSVLFYALNINWRLEH